LRGNWSLAMFMMCFLLKSWHYSWFTARSNVLCIYISV
jgi:hypothetical protein